MVFQFPVFFPIFPDDNGMGHHTLPVARVAEDFYDPAEEPILGYSSSTNSAAEVTESSDSDDWWLDCVRCHSPAFSTSSNGSSTDSLLRTPLLHSINPLEYAEDYYLGNNLLSWLTIHEQDEDKNLDIPPTPMLSTIPLSCEDDIADANIIGPFTPLLSTIPLPSEESEIAAPQTAFVFCNLADEIFIPSRDHILPPPIGTKKPSEEASKSAVPTNHSDVDPPLTPIHLWASPKAPQAPNVQVPIAFGSVFDDPQDA